MEMETGDKEAVREGESRMSVIERGSSGCFSVGRIICRVIRGCLAAVHSPGAMDGWMDGWMASSHHGTALVSRTHGAKSFISLHSSNAPVTRLAHPVFTATKSDMRVDRDRDVGSAGYVVLRDVAVTPTEGQKHKRKEELPKRRCQI